MAKSDLIEYTSEAAYDLLKKGNDELLRTIDLIDKANTKTLGVKTPSGSDSAIKALNDQLLAQDAVIKKLQADYQKLSETYNKPLGNPTKPLQTAYDELTKTFQEQQAEARKLGVELGKGSKEFKEAAKAAGDTKKQIDDLNKTIRQGAGLDSYYNAVQNKINSLSVEYNNLAAKQSLNIKLTTEEEKRLGFLTGKLIGYENVLKKVDAARGKFGREVGNYSKGTEQLNRSITQISTEIPNFFQSFEIGIRSITNNIQPVRDGLKGVRDEAKMAGTQVPSAFSLITKSFLSWQTVLFVGVGLLSAYSGEIAKWVKELFNGKQALDEVTKAHDEYTAARLKSSAKTEQEVQTTRQYIKIAKELTAIQVSGTKLSIEQQDRLAVAIQKVREAGKYYFKDLQDGEIFTQKGEIALNRFNDALEKQAELQDAQSGNLKTKERIKELEAELNARQNYVDKLKKYTDEINNSGANKQLKELAEEDLNRLEAYEKRRKKARDSKEDETLMASDLEIQKQVEALTASEEAQRRKIKGLIYDSLILEGKVTKERKARKEKEYDPEGAILAARLRYLKELKEANDTEYEASKTAKEREISDLDKLAKDERRSFQDRIEAYGEMLQKREQLLADDLARTSMQMAEQQQVELAESDKALRAELKRAGNNASAIKKIRQYYSDEQEMILQKFNSKRLDADRKNSIELQKIAEETSRAELEIIKKRDETIQDTDKKRRDSQIKYFTDQSKNEKLQLNIRQSLFRESIALQRKQLDLDKQRELSAAGDNDALIENIRERYRILNNELDQLNKTASPFALTLEKVNAELADMKKGIVDSFFGDAGLGSLSKFFDGTFEKVMQGFDLITTETQEWGNIMDAASERALKKFQYVFGTVAELAKAAFSEINKANEARFQAQYTRLEKERDVAIDFAGESAEAKADIDRQYDQKRRAIQRAEAKQKKEAAIFEAIINTATASVAALPNFVLAGVVAGLGAIQIALISSQPLPEFAKGTDSAPGGWSWTQEQGAEIITDKNDRIKSLGSSGGRKKTFLEKGDKVKTAFETRSILQEAAAFDQNLNRIIANNGIVTINNSSNGAPTIDYDRLGGSVAKAMKKVPTKGLILDKRGFTDYVEEGFNRTEYQNKRVSRKGRNV